MNARIITLTAAHIGTDILGCAWIIPMKDLDMYRVGRVWHTIWHRDQQTHGATVDEVRQLGGGRLRVGQPLIFQMADEQIAGHGRVTAISIMDPAQASSADIANLVSAFDRSALQTESPQARCWYVTFEPVALNGRAIESGRSGQDAEEPQHTAPDRYGQERGLYG